MAPLVLYQTTLLILRVLLLTRLDHVPKTKGYLIKLHTKPKLWLKKVFCYLMPRSEVGDSREPVAHDSRVGNDH